MPREGPEARVRSSDNPAFGDDRSAALRVVPDRAEIEEVVNDAPVPGIGPVRRDLDPFRFSLPLAEVAANLKNELLL